MAPLRGETSRAAQPPKSILKSSSSSFAAANSDLLFAASKKDKRRIKHAELMNKVTKSATKKPRRRRPNKKLVTTLDALADALPDDDDDDKTNSNSATGGRPEDQVNIIRRKSMKSRPGAMKRREKVDNSERDRFAKNLAQLAAAKPVAKAGDDKAVPSTSERWAALRGFISQTLETKPELKTMKT